MLPEIDQRNSSDHQEFEGEDSLDPELKDDVPMEQDVPNPYPDAIVNIGSESTSVFQLKRKYDKVPPLIKLDPDFQRHEVWSPNQKSELIESILMGIPLPLIYVKEDDKGVYIIVDGRQRLTTLFAFMNHQFPLEKLKVLSDLNGAYFSETSEAGLKHTKYLTQTQQSKIEDCQLTLQVIKPPTQDRITFDLFDRVNRGGTRLNKQEMRNAIHQGEATKLLNQLVGFDNFKKATENSIKSDRMKDKYLVLRLIGFYLWRKKRLLSVKERDFQLVEYRSDLEDFLGKTMLFLNDPRGNEFCKIFPDVFNKAMNACLTILGPGCFRLSKNGDGPRRPINMALFETISYLIIELLDQLDDKKEIIKSEFKKLLSDKDFIRSTEYIVDSNKSVHKRFETIDKIIEVILNA